MLLLYTFMPGKSTMIISLIHFSVILDFDTVFQHPVFPVKLIPNQLRSHHSDFNMLWVVLDLLYRAYKFCDDEIGWRSHLLFLNQLFINQHFEENFKQLHRLPLHHLYDCRTKGRTDPSDRPEHYQNNLCCQSRRHHVRYHPIHL